MEDVKLRFGLSRCTETIQPESVKAICNLQHAQPHHQSLSIISDASVDPSLPSQKLVDVKAEQRRDRFIKDWIYWISEHRKPDKQQLSYSPLNNWFLNNYEKLKIIDGVLYREIESDAFGIEDTGTKEPSTKYAEAMKERLKKAYELASRSAKTAQGRQKEGYDKRARGAILQPGDRVLVKVVAFEGKHKIADKWEEDTYRIVRQPNKDIPVYVVQKENGEGRKRTLDRNLLLPIGHLPGLEKATEPKRNPAPRKPPIKTVLDEKKTNSDSTKEGRRFICRRRTEQHNSDAVCGRSKELSTWLVTIILCTLPDTSGDTEADTDNTTAQDNTQQQPARLRRRRILPTPPRELPSRTRIRKPPAYLKDYITKQAIGQTSWLQKAEWLKLQLKEGMFRGMENDITRTIIEIVRETS
ncbi:Hypothetical predicted protein [Mytilus galloprovincialis]|uniref:Uncharacterized protein n=1 Tax=Mytilus galloprovincialis TaxID=29158 RepID=A0A8B6C3P1_MYTGA|nr:Hypothetical predicted protein [Mytilus galloprovincialis]